ncbi:MAG: DUF3021 family protein [Clostridiales bacterium]|nr:DUF3021 family protein [Clostridiales bacterium]
MTYIIKKLVRDYFIIFGCIIFIITHLRLLFSPQPFDLGFILDVMLFALLGDLLSLILYSPKEISEKELKMRYIIHFISLEIVLLSFGYVGGYVTEPLAMMIFAAQIAIIYLLIRFLGYRSDKNITDQINKRLNELKKD